jgi:hypothetical protein
MHIYAFKLKCKQKSNAEVGSPIYRDNRSVCFFGLQAEAKGTNGEMDEPERSAAGEHRKKETNSDRLVYELVWLVQTDGPENVFG